MRHPSVRTPARPRADRASAAWPAPSPRCSRSASAARLAAHAPPPPRRPPRRAPRWRTAAASNPPTPGNFTGYGFDQCLAPTQQAMDAWLEHLAVPRRRHLHLRRLPRLPAPAQPDARPGSATQLAKGWRLLPITLGPQASCQPRFPRYGDDFDDQPRARQHGSYADGPHQGARRGRQDRRRRAGARHRRPAARSGTTSRASTSPTPHCRESALAFLTRLDQPGARPGLRLRGLLQRRLRHQDARRRPACQAPRPVRGCPTRSGSPAGTASPTPPRPTSREDGWRPGGRVKQYRGGHDETWGGVTDQHRQQLPRPRPRLGRRARDPLRRRAVDFRATRPCRRRPPARLPGSAGQGAPVPARPSRASTPAGSAATYNARPITAVRAWQREAGQPVSPSWPQRHWVALLAAGDRAGAQGRLRRHGGPPRPAGPERRPPGRGGRRHRRLRPATDDRRGEGLPEAASGSPRVRDHRRPHLAPARQGRALSAALAHPPTARRRRRHRRAVPAYGVDGQAQSGSADRRADDQRDADEHRDRDDAGDHALQRLAHQPGGEASRAGRPAPRCGAASRRRAGPRARRASRTGTVTNGGTAATRPRTSLPSDQRWSTATSTVVRQ